MKTAYHATNLYDILQVRPNAQPEVIIAAGRALLQIYHPDKGGDADLAAKINQAREVLLDPSKRKAYDKTLDAKVGDTIGSYRLVRKMSEGGFGEVYEAVHDVIGERVCIKMNLDVSPLHTDLFIKEARAIWDLRHHALPAVRDFYKLDNGKWALVMSYIPGPTLLQVIEKYQGKNEQMDSEHVCWMMERVLDGLRYMHYHGVVHGDVKPQNIIIQPEEHTCALVDFGLASVRPTSNSQADGYTEIFASPESLRGGPLLPESDLYSLGLTMIYALGGDPRGKRLPKATNPLVRDFISDLVIVDVNRRPHWENTDLVHQLRAVRKKAFGRVHTDYKKL